MSVSYEQASLEQRSRRFTDQSFTAYKQWPHFTHRTQRGRVHWMLLFPSWIEHRINGDATDNLNKIIMAEGWSDSIDDAWSSATKTVGTEQLYLGGGHAIRDLIQTRAEQRRQERWAAKTQNSDDTAVTRYVYSYERSRYYEKEDPFPYRRWRILRETKQFFFVQADGYGEPINANGEPPTDDFHTHFRSGRGSSYRIAKIRFEEEEEYCPKGAADMGSGWRTTEVWMSLPDLVAHVARRSPQNDNTRRIPHTDKSWREVLSLDAEQHLELIDVKRAYRKALLTAHPDHGGSRVQLEIVQQAYEIGRQMIAAV